MTSEGEFQFIFTILTLTVILNNQFLSFYSSLSSVLVLLLGADTDCK